jgi:hypothetical protein
MSESAIAATDTSDGLQADPTGRAAVFGEAMTHRARSQSVLARHWSPVGVVGAVGRASVGFGLAVGRSRSIRPTVRFSDLNTAALRPSFDVVRRHRGVDIVDHLGDPDRGAAGEPAAPARAVATTSVSPMRAVESKNSVAAANRAAVERARRHPKRRDQPTWTEQIIQRSSIGFVAPAPGVGAPASAVPADFVPSGDARLDRLRLMVSERERSHARGADPGATSRSDVPRVGATTDPERSVLRRTIADEPTIAVPAQGPGRLARAMRPESAIAPALPGARLGGPPAPVASSVAPPRAGSSPAPADRRSASRSARSPQPSRLDQLRSILVEQGILDSESESGGNGPSPRDERPPEAGSDRGPVGTVGVRAADPAGERRPTSTSSDLQAAATVRTTSGPRSAASVSPSAPDPTAGSPGTVTPATVDRLGAGTPPPHPESASRPAGDASRPRALALVERSADTLQAPLRVERRPPATSAQQLRSQRLLRSGLVPSADPPTSDAATSDTSTSDTAPLQPVDLLTEPVRTSASIDRVVTRALPTLVTAERSQLDAQLPSLARVDSSPSTVIRRVTLPRALSAVHRPAATATPPQDRAASDPARSAPAQRVERTSTVTLAEAAAGDAATSTPVRALATDATNLSFAPHAAAPDARPLLQVVRRIAAAEAGATALDVTRVAPIVSAATTMSHALPGPTADPSPDGSASIGAAEVGVDNVSIGNGEPRRAPAEQVADQFMSVLSETMRRSPAPLPTTYRPLADAIAGPRPVMLSTDMASRKALRSVGKVAATTGDTIHLDRRAISSARLDEVMAHELTHIAHPSPTPRFFDDIDDSPEERRAEQVDKLMARSPLAPSASASAPAVRRSADARTIRRTADTSSRPSASPTSSSDSVSAGALAASLTRSSASQDVVRRWESATPSPRPVAGSHRSSEQSPRENSRSAPEPTDPFDSPGAADWFRRQLDANMQRVVRQLEARMIVELERRGGRSWRST